MEKIIELRKLDSKKLAAALTEAQKELFKVNFESENGQGKNFHMIKNYRKYIARIKTLMKETPEVKSEVKPETN